MGGEWGCGVVVGVAMILSLLRSLIVFCVVPTACAVGCILAPLCVCFVDGGRRIGLAGTRRIPCSTVCTTCGVGVLRLARRARSLRVAFLKGRALLGCPDEGVRAGVGVGFRAIQFGMFG